MGEGGKFGWEISFLLWHAQAIVIFDWKEGEGGQDGEGGREGGQKGGWDGEEGS